MTLAGFVFGAIGAILAWLTTEFVGRPFRRFFDMRGEVSRRLVQYDNVMARAKMVDGTQREPIKLSKQEDTRLAEAQNTFRDLASQMRGFAQAEPLAAMIVERVFKYEPMKISTALIGYSNEISTYGEGRHLYKVQIEKLLRIGLVAG